MHCISKEHSHIISFNCFTYIKKEKTTEFNCYAQKSAKQKYVLVCKKHKYTGVVDIVCIAYIHKYIVYLCLYQGNNRINKKQQNLVNAKSPQISILIKIFVGAVVVVAFDSLFFVFFSIPLVLYERLCITAQIVELPWFDAIYKRQKLNKLMGYSR